MKGTAMPNKPNPSEALFRKRFAAFKKLSEELGEQGALERMFDGYPEKHRKRMGQYIDTTTLAEGFRNAISEFNSGGWEMEVVDLSNKGVDAVLEIQKVCPAEDVCKEFGYEKPCFLVCDIDGQATKEVFPEIRARSLCTQADGACVCMFMFEREPIGKQ